MKNRSQNSSNQNTDTKKKKSFGKKLLTFFLYLFIVLIGLIGGLVVAFYLTDPTDLVDIASEQLYAQYSREIRADSLQFSLIKGISLSNIQLSERGGFQKGVSVEFDEGFVVYNPIALLSGKVDIIKISVSGFYSTYNKLMDIIEDFTPESTDEPVEEEESKGVITFQIREIEVVNSQFVYNEIPLNFEISFSPNDVFIKSEISAKIYSMYGEISFVGTLSGATLIVNDLEVNKFAEIDANIYIDRLKAVLMMGDDNIYSVTGQVLKVNVMGFDIHSYSEFFGSYNNRVQYVELESFKLNVNGSDFTVKTADYSVKSGSFNLSIDDIDAEVSDFLDDAKGNILGNITVAYYDGFDITGNIQVDGFKYSPIESGDIELLINNNYARGEAVIETAGGDLNAVFNSVNLLSKTLYVDITSETIDIISLLDSLDINERSGSENDETTALDLPPIEVSLLIDEALYDEIEIEDIALYCTYKKGLVVLESLTLEVMSGDLSLNGILNQDEFSGDLTYDGGKLRQITKTFLEGDKKLYGTIDFYSDFCLNLSDIYNSVVEVDLSVENGEIRDFILQDEISKVLYNVPLDDIFFDDISVSGMMNDRVFNLVSFDFTSDNINASASGTIFPEDEEMELDALVSIDQDYISGLPNLAILFTSGYKENGFLNFLINVEGSLKQPDVSLQK